jgi:UDP-2,3-diacylglucosamine hydrolase
MSLTPLDRLIPLRTPAHWQAVDFISDLHLQASEPATFRRWQTFMERPAHEQPDALFILGDFLEVWAGDDLLQADAGLGDSDFWRSCFEVLARCSVQRPIYFMHGNRDFLLGQVAANSAGLTLLSDPTVLDFHGRRYLLSHGDALCLADTDYLRFRAMVRSPEWQRQFLAKPLAERLQITRDLRERSEAHKQAQGHDPVAWADVDGEAALAWLEAAQATTLIHGHTHRAGRYALGRGCERIVLSDWHADARPPRGDFLRLTRQGLQRHSLYALPAA